MNTNNILQIVLFSLLCYTTGYAQNRELSFPNYGFSFEVPDGYENHSANSPLVPVLIFRKEHRYPEFNIVTEPIRGHSHSSMDMESWETRLANEYAMVGITSISIERSYQALLDMGIAYLASELTYTLENNPIKSIVGRIYTKDVAITLTIKDLPDRDFENIKADFETFLKGLKLDPNSVQTGPDTKDSMVRKLIIAVAILAVIFTVFFKRRKKNQ